MIQPLNLARIWQTGSMLSHIYYFAPGRPAHFHNLSLKPQSFFKVSKCINRISFITNTVMKIVHLLRYICIHFYNLQRQCLYVALILADICLDQSPTGVWNAPLSSELFCGFVRQWQLSFGRDQSLVWLVAGILCCEATQQTAHVIQPVSYFCP